MITTQAPSPVTRYTKYDMLLRKSDTVHATAIISGTFALWSTSDHGSFIHVCHVGRICFDGMLVELPQLRWVVTPFPERVSKRVGLGCIDGGIDPARRRQTVHGTSANARSPTDIETVGEP